MARKLRYSERKQLAEAGSLGDLSDEVPPSLRVAVSSAIDHAPQVGKPRFLANLRRELVEHFGDNRRSVGEFIVAADTEAFLDLLEIAVENAARHYTYNRRAVLYYPGLEERLSDLMERHRFGYRLEDGEVRKIGSPALDVEVTGPTLLAVQQPEWDEVDKTFRRALDHQKAGETDDALTAANAAVESALKAAGMKGASLGPLMKNFRASGLVPGYLREVPELLDDLIGKLMAARSTHGDAHGKDAGAEAAEQALADLAIYWAGAFISYLAEVSRTT